MHALTSDQTFQKYLVAHDLVVVVAGDGCSAGTVGCIVRPVNPAPVKVIGWLYRIEDKDMRFAYRVAYPTTQMFFKGKTSVRSARTALRKWLRFEGSRGLRCGKYYMPFNFGKVRPQMLKRLKSRKAK